MRLHGRRINFRAAGLFHKTGGNNTGRNRDNTHAQEGNDNADDLADCRNGIDVSIADRQNGRHAPPDAGQSIAERFGLGSVLRGIHAEGTGDHQNKNDEEGTRKLGPFFIDDIGNDVKAVNGFIDAE